jgi:DNA replication protein DnaC
MGLKLLSYIEVLVMDEIVKPINQQWWASCQEYNYIAEVIDDLANDFSDTKLTGYYDWM